MSSSIFHVIPKVDFYNRSDHLIRSGIELQIPARCGDCKWQELIHSIAGSAARPHNGAPLGIIEILQYATDHPTFPTVSAFRHSRRQLVIVALVPIDLGPAGGFQA
jgi:hypothetical protein